MIDSLFLIKVLYFTKTISLDEDDDKFFFEINIIWAVNFEVYSFNSHSFKYYALSGGMLGINSKSQLIQS